MKMKKENACDYGRHGRWFVFTLALSRQHNNNDLSDAELKRYRLEYRG